MRQKHRPTPTPSAPWHGGRLPGAALRHSPAFDPCDSDCAAGRGLAVLGPMGVGVLTAAGREKT